jgi:galactokinase
MELDEVRAAFQAHFGGGPEIITRAPGRVNIIGEHTDYNHGFVLPMAIERSTVIAARRRQDQVLNAVAVNLNRTAQVSLERRTRNEAEPWIDYLVGVADELAKLSKPLSGADLVILGDVPVGCGLSSSAALEMAALCMFEALSGFRMDGPEAARLGQRVENQFLGLSTGIMDQFISRCGKAGHGLFLDCRTFEYELIPIAFPEAVFVIANTCCSRGLTKSKYNERVSECGEAVRVMSERLGGSGTHLRDYTLENLDTCRADLPEVAYRRARHVITENARTLAACEAMRAGNVERLGTLMNASDESLRTDYEVTSPELDVLAAAARQLPGCHGARMTGAGFGGCTINLVARDAASQFGMDLLAAYQYSTGIQGEIIVSKPGNGAEIV